MLQNKKLQIKIIFIILSLLLLHYSVILIQKKKKKILLDPDPLGYCCIFVCVNLLQLQSVQLISENFI